MKNLKKYFIILSLLMSSYSQAWYGGWYSYYSGWYSSYYYTAYNWYYGYTPSYYFGYYYGGGTIIIHNAASEPGLNTGAMIGVGLLFAVTHPEVVEGAYNTVKSLFVKPSSKEEKRTEIPEEMKDKPMFFLSQEELEELAKESNEAKDVLAIMGTQKRNSLRSGEKSMSEADKGHLEAFGHYMETRGLLEDVKQTLLLEDSKGD